MTTIRAVLFGEMVPAQAGMVAQKLEEAAERLAGVDAMPQRAEAGPRIMARTVMTKVADLLNIEVSDVLAGAWRTRSALLEAAKESVHQPDLSRQVIIRSYSFPWDYAMDVDVTLNRVTIATVSLTANVEVEVTALAAIIQNGRITRIAAGDLTTTAALRVSSRTAMPVAVPLAQGERTLPLHVELTLPGSGLSLVDSAPGDSPKVTVTSTVAVGTSIYVLASQPTDPTRRCGIGIEAGADYGASAVRYRSHDEVRSRFHRGPAAIGEAHQEYLAPLGSTLLCRNECA